MIHSGVYLTVALYTYNCSSQQSVFIGSLLLHCLCSHERDTITSVSGDQQYNLTHKHTAHLSGLNSTSLQPHGGCSEPKWLPLFHQHKVGLRKPGKLIQCKQPNLEQFNQPCPHNTISKPHQPHRQIKTCSCVLLPLHRRMCVRGELSLFWCSHCKGYAKYWRSTETDNQREAMLKNHTHRGTCQQVHLITTSWLQTFDSLMTNAMSDASMTFELWLRTPNKPKYMLGMSFWLP